MIVVNLANYTRCHFCDRWFKQPQTTLHGNRAYICDACHSRTENEFNCRSNEGQGIAIKNPDPSTCVKEITEKEIAAALHAYSFAVSRGSAMWEGMRLAIAAYLREVDPI